MSAQIFGDGCKSRRHRRATDTRMPFTKAAAASKERQLKQYLLRRCMNTNDRWIRYREVLMRTELGMFTLEAI